MKKVITRIGLFLSSTDTKILNHIGRDRFSVLKQCILGFSIFIPPLIAFISLKHIFSTIPAIEANEMLLNAVSIVGALIVLFLDFATVFFLSIYQNRTIYITRILYSMILGFFLAIVAAISFNIDYLNELYVEQSSIEKGYNEEIQRIEDEIATIDSLITVKQGLNENITSLIFRQRLLKEDLAEVEERKSKEELKGIFSEISFLYDESIKRGNYTLGFQVFLFLMIIMSFDVIPIIFKMIGFDTKYDIYLRSAYYQESALQNNKNNMEQIANDLFIDDLNKADPKILKKKTKNLKIYLEQLPKQLHYFSIIKLMQDYISKEKPTSENEEENQESSKSDTLYILVLSAILTIPEFLFLIWWLSFNQVNNLVVYTSFFTTIFYLNKVIANLAINKNGGIWSTENS